MLLAAVLIRLCQFAVLSENFNQRPGRRQGRTLLFSRGRLMSSGERLLQALRRLSRVCGMVKKVSSRCGCRLVVAHAAGRVCRGGGGDEGMEWSLQREDDANALQGKTNEVSLCPKAFDSLEGVLLASRMVKRCWMRALSTQQGTWSCGRVPSQGYIGHHPCQQCTYVCYGHTA
jgi:hypothetical protein